MISARHGQRARAARREFAPDARASGQWPLVVATPVVWVLDLHPASPRTSEQPEVTIPRRAALESVSNLVLVASVTAIVVVTLLPAPGDNVVRLWPFDDIGEAFLEPDRVLLLETAANILLFVPFGAALSLRGFAIGKTALSGLLLSAIVESAQLLFISGRTTSLDDLLLNTVGAMVGYAVLARRARDTS